MITGVPQKYGFIANYVYPYLFAVNWCCGKPNTSVQIDIGKKSSVFIYHISMHLYINIGRCKGNSGACSLMANVLPSHEARSRGIVAEWTVFMSQAQKDTVRWLNSDHYSWITDSAAFDHLCFKVFWCDGFLIHQSQSICVMCTDNIHP